MTEEGSLEVEIVRQRYGAFADFEPVDPGETHAAVEHGFVGFDPSA